MHSECKYFGMLQALPDPNGIRSKPLISGKQFDHFR